MRPAPIRLLAIGSDFHSGSTVALMPPTLELAEGLIVTPNALQSWFWDCYQDGLRWLDTMTAGDPFALALNGDLIEGDHHRSDQIIGRNIADHIACAKETLQPLVSRAAKTFITRGTECHVGDSEATLGVILGAEQNPETKRHVFDRLTLDICGVRVVIRHHVSTTSRPWLESNGLGMELASEQLNAVRNGEPMPRVLCVGHRHVGGHVQTTDGICLATPAWQGLTKHGHKVVPASRCKPGFYLLDWRGKARGELPTIHRRIYDAPHAKAISI